MPAPAEAVMAGMVVTVNKALEAAEAVTVEMEEVELPALVAEAAADIVAMGVRLPDILMALVAEAAVDILNME